MHFTIILSLIVSCCLFHPVIGQNEDQQSSSQSPRPVNIFVIHDEENIVAQRSVANSLKSLKTKHPDWLGSINVVPINGSDPRRSLDKICLDWDRKVRGGGPNVPDFVLDTTRSGFGAETVSSFTAAIGIPTLSAQFGQEGDLRYWQNLKNNQSDYLIQIMPPADLVPEAVRQLAIQMNITNAAIIFDENFVMDHKYKSLLLNVPTRHVIVRSKKNDLEIDSQLTRLRDLDIVNYFILGDENILTQTLNIGESKNFTGRKYGWYAFTLNDDMTLKCECRNISVLFFKPKVTTQNQQLLSELTTQGVLPPPLLSSAFYYDFARLGVRAMRRAIMEKSWPSEPRYMTCNEYQGNNTPERNFNFLKFLNKSTSDDDFKPTFASFHWGKKNGEHRAKFEMKVSMVMIDNGNPVSIDDLAEWPAGIDSPLEFSESNKQLVINHTAITSFRIVTVEMAPFMIKNKETGEWTGYCIDLINEICDIMKVEYEIHEAPDGHFGSMAEDGTWNGMIKELQDKRADIALGALSVMAERENVVDFTVPYYDLVGISILMQKPKTPTSLFKFLTVLENEVWLCILGSYFFTSFLMWLFDRWSPYSYQNNKEKYVDDEEKREFDLKECLWFCMTSLTPQGGGEAPKNLSGRLVAATWWLFGFIIIASYTANLAAFLTVSRLDTPVESLEDLSKQYKIQYAPNKPSEAYTYFERMAAIEERFYEIWKDMSLNDNLTNIERAKLAVWDYPVSDRYSKMFQSMKESHFPSSVEEGLLRVRGQLPNYTSSEFAFIGDATTIKYLEMTNCDLMMVGDEFSRKPYAIAVQQGSPLKDQLNNAILQLLNRRQLEQLKNKWWNNNPLKKICKKEDDQSDGISIQNIGGVFIVILVGIVLACGTLAFEYYWYRYRPMIQQQNRSTMNKFPPQDIKPIRFNLKPAKQSFTNAEFRSRF
ncbi:hypothetical protein PV325_008825 [Microctonus aethiopoides]|nr:hypothetical protein PV325_008825 [Microctonus aethiopoides]